MIVKKAFKYRIYPNKEQQHKLAIQFGHTRFVYNRYRAWREQSYQETGKGLSYNQTAVDLTGLKKEPEFEWLKEADSQVLQQKLKDLETAYKNFFAGQAKYPNFKSKRGKQTIRYPQRFKLNSKKIYLPKVGWVKLKQHRQIEGEMKNATVSKTKSGKYFVSIQCELEKEDPSYQGSQIGIDLGLIDFVTASTGKPIPAPKHLRKAERKLKRLQRQMSRKHKGSNGWQKARLRLARQAEKVANQRQDFQHKLSRELIEQNELIGFENLNVVGMLKNHHLAKSIQDAAWSQFVRFCEYKGAWYGCQIEKVGRFFPSSKLCSACGQKQQSLKLSERKWLCIGCGVVHKRDENAAKNILKEIKNTVGATGINADGENVRPARTLFVQAVSLKSEATQL